VNRPANIIVPPPNIPPTNSGQARSAGYGGRPWSPSATSSFSQSPRSAHPGSLSAGPRRSTPGYHPYASQPSPTGLPQYSPSYVVSPWGMQTPSPQEMPENYSGTGFHHLLDQPSTIPRLQRPPEVGYIDSSNVMGLPPRRLQRGDSYSYGIPPSGASASPSPISTPTDIPPTRGYTGSPSLLPRDDSPYGRMMYAPIQISPTSHMPGHPLPGANTATQMQGQPPSQMLHSINYPPQPSPSSHSHPSSYASSPSQPSRPSNYSDPPPPQSQYPDPSNLRPSQDHSAYPHDTSYSHDPSHYSHDSSHSYSDFAVPSHPSRRPTLTDVSTQSTSSTSVVTYSTSSTNTTQPVDADSFRTYDPHIKPPPRTNLTPNTLADHTHVHETLHEQHVEDQKQSLSVDNGAEVEVMEYLETLPVKPESS